MSKQGQQKMKLGSQIISTFKMAKIFKQNKSSTYINGLDIDESGQYVVASSSDNSLKFYDSLQAKYVYIVLLILAH